MLSKQEEMDSEYNEPTDFFILHKTDSSPIYGSFVVFHSRERLSSRTAETKWQRGRMK